MDFGLTKGLIGGNFSNFKENIRTDILLTFMCIIVMLLKAVEILLKYNGKG